MLKKFTIQPGNEIRGFKFKIYPTKEQEELLLSLQHDLRITWNFLVRETESVLKARKAYAIKNKLVGVQPIAPNYSGIKPEEAKAIKEKYIKECLQWSKDVWNATNKLPECSFRKFKDMMEHFECKQDYQLLEKIINWKYQEEDNRKIKPGSCLLQCLYRNYKQYIKGHGRKNFKKKDDLMPLQVKTGKCFELGDFGKRRNKSFYNCQISINRLKIKGRLPGKTPQGIRVLEGVSITKLADGWYASIKEEIPIRKLEEPIKDSIVGIDVGLDNIAAMAFPKDTIPDTNIKFKSRIENKRGKEFAERIAGRQKLELPTSRLHLQATRHMKHTIYNEIIKPLAKVETIKIEDLNSSIGQMGSSKLSVMRLIASLLKERYGSRVREVDCRYTSQDCSQCGNRSKESWSYEHGRYGECNQCGYKEDRDINAARNIAAKPIESLMI